MKFKDKDLWDRAVANNQDFYGSGVIRFAERWADKMEEMMVDGKDVKDVAKEACRIADTEGITGFMYGAAVAKLSACWEHGEKLRRWHNLDTDHTPDKRHGEKANETEGGVINPAIFVVGTED